MKWHVIPVITLFSHGRTHMHVRQLRSYYILKHAIFGCRKSSRISQNHEIRKNFLHANILYSGDFVISHGGLLY